MIKKLTIENESLILTSKSYTFFYKKIIFFCLGLNFLNIMLEIRLRFFLTLTLFFSFNAMFPSLNLSMFTEEDGTIINNEDRKEFSVRKNAKIYSIL